MGERCEPILNLLNVSKIAAHIERRSRKEKQQEEKRETEMNKKREEYKETIEAKQSKAK